MPTLFPKKTEGEQTGDNSQQVENINANINVDSGDREIMNTTNINKEDLPHVEGVEPKKKLTKCKKWPLCKNDTCTFSHPKETVNLFYFIFSAHTSLNAYLEINVYLFILMLIANSDFTALELVVLIRILLGTTQECILI